MMGIERSKGPLNYLPPAMKETSEFEVHKLCTSEPPTHIFSWVEQGSPDKPRRFFEVRLDRREVMETWPKRSLLDRFRGNSPVERIGDYQETFRKQDEWYAKNF
jgi:hypothetical protein